MSGWLGAWAAIGLAVGPLGLVMAGAWLFAKSLRLFAVAWVVFFLVLMGYAGYVGWFF